MPAKVLADPPVVVGVRGVARAALRLVGRPLVRRILEAADDPPREVRVVGRPRECAGELAAKIGVSRAYLARLEMGRHDPPLSRLRALAKALKVDIAKLLK